jgi:hypothetical protein
MIMTWLDIAGDADDPGDWDTIEQWSAGLTPQQAWKTCARPDWMLRALRVTKCADDRYLREFACRAARSVQARLRDARSSTAVQVAERYTRGEATAEELAAAYVAAEAAAVEAYEGVSRTSNTPAHQAACKAFWAAKAAAATCAADAHEAAQDANGLSTDFDTAAATGAARAEEIRQRFPWETIEPLFAETAAV